MEKSNLKPELKKPLRRRGWGGKSPSLAGVGEAPKILVIQQKMIGDVLVSSLICENLKLNYPEAEVHYLVNRFTIPVIENNPYIDKIVVFEDEFRSSKLKFYKFLKKIRKAKYDVVIDAYGKLESNLITIFSGAKTKISWKKSYTKLHYTKTIKIVNESKMGLGSAIENRLNLVKGFRNSKIYSKQPKIYLTPKELDSAKTRIELVQNKQSNAIIMISALGSNPSKTYPLAYMAKVLDVVANQTNASLILNYMPQQKGDIMRLYGMCLKKTQNHILIDFEIKSLRDFLTITKFCKAVIGNEGGATNMAKALNVPTFSIFSPCIDKQGWNGLENHTLKHVSVHLKDFKPDFISKKNTEAAYQLFKPDLFLDLLNNFIINRVN